MASFGGGNSNDIDIVVRVDANGAISVLDSLGKTVANVESTIKKGESSWTTYNQALQAVTQTYSLVTSAASKAGNALIKGSDVNDVAESFSRLSQQAGTTAEAFQNKLAKAVDYTISTFDLQKKGIDALRAGLKPDEFIAITKAARQFGEEGSNLTTQLDELMRAYVMGSDKLLKQKNIVIDNAKAEKELSQALYGKIQSLNETGKLEANRLAILRAIIELEQKNGQVITDTGDRVMQLRAQWENNLNTVLSNIAKSEDLNKALADIGTTIASIPWESIAVGITKTFDLALRGVQQLLVGLDALAAGGPGNLIEWQLNADTLDAAFEKLNTTLGQKTPEAVARVKGSISTMANGINEAFKNSPTLLAKYTNQLAELQRRTESTTEAQTKESSASAILKTRTDELRQKKESYLAIDTKVGEQAKKNAESLKNALLSSELYKNVTKELTDGIITESQAADKIKWAIGGVIEANRDAALAEEELNKLFLSGKASSEEYAAALAKLASAKDRAATSGSTFVGPQPGIGTGTSSEGGFFSGLFGGALGVDLSKTITEGVAWENIGQSVGSQLGSAISQALTAAITGEGVSGPQMAGAAGSAVGTIGGALIGSLGGPVGIAIGASMGGAIGQGLGTAIAEKFGKDSKGTAARKKVDEYFAELFEAQRLSIIVNGQLTEMQDLVFGGETLFGGLADLHKGEIDQYIATLAPGVQAAFEGVGAAFEELQGIDAAFQGYLGAALANNLGDLNNLQIALEATGKSADELNNALMQAFMKGKLTAIEYMTQLQSLQDVLTKGIPGALGAVGQAMANVAAAGKNGGRTLLNALGDVGTEAQELGINTLPQLADIMINRFGIAAQVVSQFMQAMAATGIQSVNDLANASNDVLAALAANLQAIQEGNPATFKPIVTQTVGSSGGGSSRSTAAKDAAKAKADKTKQFNSDLYGALEGSAVMNAALANNTDLNDVFAKGTQLLHAKERADAAAAKAAANHSSRLNELQKAANAADDAWKNYIKTQEELKQDSETLTAMDRLGQLLAANKLGADGLAAAFEAAGVSMRDMQNSAVQAYKYGKASLGDAFQQYQNAGPGIAGKTGAVGEAFRKALSLGTGGGALTMNALKGIAAEGKEVGLTSLDDLYNKFQEQGVAVTQTTSFFQALSKAGIKDIDALFNASDDTLFNLINDMSEAKLPFEETTDAVKDLLSQISQIPDQKTMEMHINLDAESKALLEQLTGNKITFGSGYGDPDHSPGLRTKRTKRERRKEYLRTHPNAGTASERANYGL